MAEAATADNSDAQSATERTPVDRAEEEAIILPTGPRRHRAKNPSTIRRGLRWFHGVP